jgi:hypothetical protein
MPAERMRQQMGGKTSAAHVFPGRARVNKKPANHLGRIVAAIKYLVFLFRSFVETVILPPRFVCSKKRNRGALT